jgi:hypothetical protein
MIAIDIPIKRKSNGWETIFDKTRLVLKLTIKNKKADNKIE